MKKLLATLVAGLLAANLTYANHEPDHKDSPKTKKVCVDIQGKDGKPAIDPKTKKVKQDCKTVKIHKKHEGTKIPDKKK